jgi:hypothetical protein
MLLLTDTANFGNVPESPFGGLPRHRGQQFFEVAQISGIVTMTDRFAPRTVYCM